MKKKLLLINVVDTASYAGAKNVYPNRQLRVWQPVQLGIIASLTPDDWDIEILDENFEIFHYQNADLVGVSSFTPSINEAYRIAKIYRENNTPTIIGGVHASLLPDEALQYFDTVAVGKAEGLWADVIRDFNNNSLKRIYYSNENAEICFKPDRSVFKKYNYPSASIISSLGCTNNCFYCNIPFLLNHKYYLRDVDEIINEINQVEQEYFLFNDDNFFGSNDVHRARIVTLLTKMISLKIKKKWFCITSINIASHPEILNLAHRAGCVIAFIGMESTNMEELKQYNKNENFNFVKDNYKTAIDTFHKNKIAVWGSFICGGIEETIDTMILKGITLRKMNLDNANLGFLTPLPKTVFYKELENKKLLTYTLYPKDWIYFNFTTLTYKSKYGNTSDFHNAYQKAISIIYSPYKGLIKNYRIRKFFSTLFNTKSIKVAVYSSYLMSLWNESMFNSRFFKILFKLFIHNKRKRTN